MKPYPRTTFSGILAGLASFLLCTSSAFSATGKSTTVSAREFMGSFSSSPKMEMVASTQQRNFVLSTAKAAQIFSPAADLVLTDFPIGIKGNGVLELERTSPVVDGETVILINGKEPYTPPAVQTFRGKIRGEDKSRVVLTMVGGNMVGMVEHEDGARYILSPATSSKKDVREHVLYSDDAVAATLDRSFICSTPDDDEHHQALEPVSKFLNKDKPLSTDLLQVDIAIETDYALFKRLNPDINTADPEVVYNYIVPLIAMVSTLYEDEINVTFHISYYNIWTEEDPYAAGGDISQILRKFSAYWATNKRGVPRDIAHLITGPGSTDVGGIAWLNTLCNKGSGGYGGFSVSGIRAVYTYPTIDYTWDVNVIAHELGHNFASPHTHVCSFWGHAPLDTCVSKKVQPIADDACFDFAPKRAEGSIMSYCHLLNGKVPLFFTEPVAQVIRQGAELASCVAPPAAATVVLQNPLGNQALQAGKVTDIRWTSSRITMVGLEYSSDNGKNWKNIVESVPATDRKYSWTVPAIASTEMLVRIYDVNDHDVNYTSRARFSVQSPTLSVFYPAGGERLPQQSDIAIKWQKSLVESVAIDFSSNNGATWTPVATGVGGDSYTWKLPVVATSEAVIRVRDESNNAIIDQSNPFTIGAPLLQVVSPAAGVEWIVGTTREIRWNADFVDKVRLEISTDNGENWTRIGPFVVDAASGTYSYEVPNTVTKDAFVRVRNIGTGSVEAMSGKFAISLTVSVDEPQAVAPASFALIPQPARDFVTVQYTLESAVASTKITLQDVTGRKVAEFAIPDGAIGNHSFTIPTASLAQGVYLVSIEAGKSVLVKPLTVIR